MKGVPPPVPTAAHTDLPGPRRWVLLALQLPATPSNARVKTWRRLQQLGAVPVKNAVYVLPASAQAVEDFAWLVREVEALGGQATLFQADAVDSASDAEIIDLFRRARADDYRHLLADARRLKPRAARGGSTDAKDLRALRERLEQIRAIDFFGAPGREDVEARLRELERLANQGRASHAPASAVVRLDAQRYQARRWVTRPRPGVDRFASAWLIRRFIDRQAQFDFLQDDTAVGDAVPFDMYDSGFGHEGERCTFEVLLLRFGLGDAALVRVAEIVHDLDLKDERYRPPQAPTIGLLVEGLRASFADDHALLQHGMHLFEALYVALLAPLPVPKPNSPTRRERRVRRAR